MDIDEPEMQNLLDRIVCGHEVSARLVDFWHLSEKLAAAARVVSPSEPGIVGRWLSELKASDEMVKSIESTLSQQCSEAVVVGGLGEQNGTPLNSL